MELFVTVLQLPDLVFQNDFVFALDVDFLIVLEEARLVLCLQLGQPVVFDVEFLLVVRNSAFGTFYLVEPAV